MARDISSALIAEKNKRDSENPFVVLVELQYDDSDWLYLTNLPTSQIYKYYKEYHDDYTGDRTKLRFPHDDGTEYEYFPFIFDKYSENKQGSVDKVNIVVDNTMRVMESYLHNYNITGRDVILRVVNLDLMTDSAAQVYDTFMVLEIMSGELVTFTIGHPSLFNSSVSKLMSRTCMWEFKGDYCTYSGAGDTCLKILGDVSTPNTCRYYDNEERFGGFPNVRTTVQ